MNPGFRRALELQVEVPEPLHVPNQVGAQEGHVLSRDIPALAFQDAKCAHHVDRVLQNEGRGDQIVVAQPLLLFIWLVDGDHIAAKRQPFGKAVIGFDLVGVGGHLLPQLAAANPLQQEAGPYHIAQLLGRKIQAVLPAVRSEFA